MGRLLEQEDGLGIVEVVLAGTTPLVVAARAQVAVRGCAPLVRVGHAVTDGHFFGDLVKAHATHTGGGAGEVFVDDFLAQAHSLEQLRATVAHDGGDAHLGHDLEHTGGKRLGEVLHGGVRVDLEVAVAGQIFHGFECQVRVHAGGTVSDQQRDMVNLAHVTGLDGHGDLRTGVAAQQVVLHGGSQQQGRDRTPRMVGLTVGEHDEVLAVGDGLVDFGEDLVKSLFEGLAAAGDLVEALDHVRAVVAAEDAGLVKALELGHLIRVDHGQRDEDLLGVQLGIGQQVRLGADGGFERGDDLLTLPVQRRVGDLRELLGEVVEQHAAAAGKRRHRRIVTHGTERFLAGVGHRREQELQILFGVAEGALTALDGLAGVADVLAAGQVAHFNGVAFHPLAVRVLGSEVPLDLFIGNDAAFGGVDQEHLAGLKTALGHDVFLRDLRQNAGLGGQNDVAVIGELPAAGTEAVAVEQGADLGAVGEDDVGRAIPRLDKRVVVLVEGAHVRIEIRVLLPSRRQHHADGVRQGAAGEVQQFEALVEGAGIGVARGGDRQQRLEFTEQFAAQAAFTGGEPVAVALDGVDLAIVGQQTERLGQRPAREGVGGEAGVDDGDGGLHALVVQILEEVGELHGGEHALVRDGTGGQGCEVDAHLMLDALADAEGLAIQVHAGQSTVRRGDHESLESWHGGKGLQAKAVRVGGHHAPCEDFESLLAHDLGNGLFLLTGGFDVAVKEGDACRIVTGFRQFGGHGGTHELIRHAHQNAGAVTCVLLGTHGTTVIKVDQHLNGVGDDLALRTLVQSGDHTHTTGVMLVGGIIHTVRSVDREIERGFECHRNHLNWLWARKKIMPLRSLLLTQYRCSMSFTFHVSIYRVAIKVNSDSQAIFLWPVMGVFRTFSLEMSI